ncbi:hypothetical protein [Desulforamulus aeronauticus]|uniref:Uncharacterized protein n=1 Tax=Desulforamulus aeronauticus DSM 10349 TaxID=1121421 RepID=A0A1M6PVM6_9FIRM|nr:hypothetical protein [Desulforamulus aeronauticus]SHK12024.1 hypothetical protein SAMN02745123_00739 [Desulforamulus aeronauticus DSM 10349]
MFHGYHRHHGFCGLFMMTVASAAMTIPFLCIMKRMANSLEIIAEKK